MGDQVNLPVAGRISAGQHGMILLRQTRVARGIGVATAMTLSGRAMRLEKGPSLELRIHRWRTCVNDWSISYAQGGTPGVSRNRRCSPACLSIVLADNVRLCRRAGSFDDWIEIYNTIAYQSTWRTLRDRNLKTPGKCLIPGNDAQATTVPAGIPGPLADARWGEGIRHPASSSIRRRQIGFARSVEARLCT